MATTFQNSLFSGFVGRRKASTLETSTLLGGHTGSHFQMNSRLEDHPIVVFDFETTGLDVRNDRIIEIGGVKFVNRREVARFSKLIAPGFPVSSEITEITGITNEMLADAPPMEKVLHDFHDFFRGCVGVAHNAEFDTQLLKYESQRLGVHCDYFVLCTLKMARQMVQSDRRTLSHLAEHFQIEYVTKHRSIDDILVTAEVLWRILDTNPNVRKLSDLQVFREAM
jgi:DNA polymerase III subunit epsilon